MKKVLLIIAALFVGMQAQAQFVADGGYLHAFETRKSNVVSPAQDGLFLGARYNIDLDDWMDGLSFIPGLNLSAIRGKVLALSVDNKYYEVPLSSTRELAINMPIHLKYQYEFMSNFAVYGFLGPTLQLGFFNNIVDRQDNAKKIINMYKEIQEPEWKLLGAKTRTPFNLYLGLGIGVEVAERILVNAAFDFGLLNMTTAANSKIHRNVLKIGIGYIF